MRVTLRSCFTVIIFLLMASLCTVFLTSYQGNISFHRVIEERTSLLFYSFELLSKRKQNCFLCILHKVDSHYEVMTSRDVPIALSKWWSSWSAILDFWIFQKPQKTVPNQ